MNKLILVILATISLSVQSQNTINLVPMPAEIKMENNNAYFEVNKNTRIILGPGISSHNNFKNILDERLKSILGYSLQVSGDKLQTKSNFIRISIAPAAISKVKQSYNLDIQKTSIHLTANRYEELFNGMQTLLQLIQNATKTSNATAMIPAMKIVDYPHFAYRGMHLDVSRHFMPVDQVKRYIDYLAMYKFNTFHWHLTDDQGWRIEIKKYPKLTEIGGWRNGTIIGRYPGTGNDSLRHGGFYTQQQIKEVVRYAAERYITVIPEIEMPGHASAAIAAYPQLSCFPEEDTKYPAGTVWAGSTKGKQVQQTWGVFEDVFCPSDYTFNFLQDVLDEVMPLFPSKYIHIGGDECPKEAWKRSAFCQQLMKENGLKDEHALQSYFIQRIEKHINSKGKKIIGWDEILEGGLAPNATVMSWRGEAGGITAAKQHHNVIMTPTNALYFDYSQTKKEDSVTIGGYNPLDAVYNYDPVPKELTAEEGKYILGAQANLWTEYIANWSKVEYHIFPRMIALAEVLWTPKEKRDWKDFERRLPVILKALDKEKISYYKAN